jgi:hypothetical protein
MKKYKKLIVLCLAVAAFIIMADSAQAVTLNQTSVSVSVGQTQTVYTSNVYGSLYISNNSYPNIASVTITGNAINVYGVSSGSTTVSVCDNTNSYSCSTLYITVNGNYYNNGYNNYNTGLNISNLSLSVGSSATITSSSTYNNYNYNTNCNYNNYNSYNYNNCGGLYVSNNTNPNVASVSTSSASTTNGCFGTNNYNIYTGQPCNGNYYNTSYYNNSSNGGIVINALSAGSDTITLCQSGNNVCNTVYLTVTGYANPLNYYYNSMPLSTHYYSTPITSSYYSNYSNYSNYTTPYNNYNYSYSPSSIGGIPVIYSNSTAN